MKRLAFTALLLASAAASHAASAQSAADTTALVHAVTARLAPPNPIRKHFYLGEPTTDFDRWVTLRLEQAHHLSLLPARADTADWIVTRGAEFRGDTAAVLVEMGTTRRPSDLIDTCIEKNRFFFARTATGWEYVRVQHVSTASLGAVRG